MQEKYQEKNGIIKVIKKDFFSVPVSIRVVGFSLFVFILGRGLGADVFFSLYVQTIVDNVFLISIIGAILSLGKMFFSIPIGEIDDHANLKSVLFISKGLYVFVWMLYVLAGMYDSTLLLIISVVFNGLASAWLMTTYQTFIRKHTRATTRGRSFGFYFSVINLAYIVWALISAYLITVMDLHHLFIFIPIFGLVSLLTDNKLLSLSKKKIRAFLRKDMFLQKFFIEVLSFHAIRKVVGTLKTYSSRMYYALSFEFFFNLLNYVGFIFIPIVSIVNNLTLSQIAIVFAVMRIPYLIDFFIGNIADHMSKRKFLFIVLLFLSLLYILLGYSEWFRNIMTITFGISLWLSLMRPVISSYVSDCTRQEDEGTMTWVGEFIGKLWEIVGVILFGIISAMFGLQTSFVVIGISIFVVALFGMIKRFRFFRNDV